MDRRVKTAHACVRVRVCVCHAPSAMPRGYLTPRYRDRVTARRGDADHESGREATPNPTPSRPVATRHDPSRPVPPSVRIRPRGNTQRGRAARATRVRRAAARGGRARCEDIHHADAPRAQHHPHEGGAPRAPRGVCVRRGEGRTPRTARRTDGTTARARVDLERRFLLSRTTTRAVYHRLPSGNTASPTGAAGVQMYL